MNKSITITAFIIFAGITFSSFQPIKLPVKKIHAYKQASIPGILPRFTDESGEKKTEERTPVYNYWFYVEVVKPEKITVSNLWVSGKRFSVKTELIPSLPVKKIIHTGVPPDDTVTLVPLVSNNVMLCYPAGEPKDSIVMSKYVSVLIKTNELVAAYYWKGKKYFFAVKSLKNLAPDVRQ